MAGHIKSIVPQRGGVAPIDNNTAALFHFDEHVKDSIRGINPIGNKHALRFNGSSTIVDFGQPLTLSTNSWTLEGWFNSSNIGALQAIVSAGGYSSNTNWVSIYNSKLALWDHNVAAWYFSSTILSSNTDYHFALAYDGLGQYTYYLNGIKDSSFPVFATTLDSLIIKNIGAYSDNTSRFFNGMIWNLKAWNRWITVDEIKLSMSSHPDSGNQGLIGYWKLDESTGTIIYDYSSSGNDGMINGTPIWTEGNTVYSFAKGMNERGILVEEGTTNIIANSGYDAFFSSTAGWNLPNVTASSVIIEPSSESLYGDSVACITDVDGNITTNTWDGLGTNSIFSLTPGTQYTMTIRYKVEGWTTGTVAVWSHWVDSTAVQANLSSDYGLPSQTFNKGWQIHSVTQTMPSGYNGKFFRPGFTLTNSGCKLYVDAIQFEAKPYSTSFVNGIRKKASLSYPKNVINASEGTISFWLNTKNKTPANFARIFNIGGWTSDRSKDSIELRWGTGWSNADVVEFQYMASGSANFQNVLVNPPIRANEWYFISVTWKANDVAHIYVLDELGALVKNQVAVGPAPTLQNENKFEVGSTSTYYLNAIIDELRIDKVVRTEAEILAWYYQGRNGW